MKYFYAFLSTVLLSIFLISCDTTDSNDDPNSLGGDTNVSFSQVGNTVNMGNLNIGNNSYDTGGVVNVTKNDNGIATLHVQADISNVPGLSAFNNFIPASMKDANGKINCNVQFKVTTEGMQDNMNVDGKLQTLAKYDGKVGDQYQLKTSNGKTITRQITERTDQDDFPYGLMLIKTIKVEQDSRIPGISKFVFRVNHKFGLVYVQLYMEDGSSAYIYLYSVN